MTRTDMLRALSCVPFTLIDPLSEWEDIGFTERPIWVNSKGYGYIMCDEPCSSCEVDGVPLEKWKPIRQKLADGSLKLQDIEGTSLSDLLEEITYGYFDEDEDDLCNILRGLVDLPSEQLERIYGVQTDDGWQFFSTQEEFNEAYERDWCDYAWETLSDEMLEEWISRLTDEGLLSGEYLVTCSTDEFIFDFQDFLESLDPFYVSYSADASEFDHYFKEVSAQLKEFLLDAQIDVFYDKLDGFYPDGDANGNISYYEAYDQFVDKTKANIEKIHANSQIQLIAKGVDGTTKGSYSLNIASLLIEVLENNTECGEFDATISRYIESSLLKFVEASSWHLGFNNPAGKCIEVNSLADYTAVLDKSHPILWFGLDGDEPIDKWSIIIGKEHGFEWIDQWYLLEYLVDDCNDCFATWYLAECGNWLPDMEEILAECPIAIDDGDDVDSINEKMLSYFIAVQ